MVAFSSEIEFLHYFSKVLAKLNKENMECYMASDFNIDILKYHTNNKYFEFFNTVTSFGFSFPTFYKQLELLNTAQLLLIISMEIILNKTHIVVTF